MSKFSLILAAKKKHVHRNLRQLAIEMYKVKNKLSPPFMQELFTHVGEGCSTRTGGDKFLRPNVDTVHNGEHSLRGFGPVLWNTMLPEKLKDSGVFGKIQRMYKILDSWELQL